MRILGLERGQGACNHYRIVQPLYKLKQQGLAEILTIHPQNAESLEFVTEKILEADVILFQRPADDKWFNLLKIAQKHGKIIVVDYDDNPFETSPLNPAYKWYGTKSVLFKWPDGREDILWQDGVDGFNIEANITRRDYFRASFKRADMVSTTTSILQDTFKEINKNTVVLPNLIDIGLFPQIECVKKEIRVGWQGGVSHYEDLFMVSLAIKEIIKKYENVKFVFFGDTRFYGLFKDIPQDRIEWHSWVQNVAYPYKLATLNLDIGICPLIDNVFNRAKSAIKYLEYSAIGVPTIASDMPPYSKVITDGKDGILADEDEWFNAIEGLVNDKIKRNVLVKNAFENIKENHSADKFAYLWRDMYEKVLKQDVVEMMEI